MTKLVKNYLLKRLTFAQLDYMEHEVNKISKVLISNRGKKAVYAGGGRGMGIVKKLKISL